MVSRDKVQSGLFITQYPVMVLTLRLREHARETFITCLLRFGSIAKINNNCLDKEIYPYMCSKQDFIILLYLLSLRKIKQIDFTLNT